MKTQIHTQINQSQQLSLSPQMQQSLRVLQMSTTEIRDLIEQSLLDNPFLDCIPTDESFSTSPEDLSAETDSSINYWKEQQVQPYSKSTDQFDFIAQQTNLKIHLLDQLYIQTTDDRLRELGAFLVDSINEDGYLNVSPGDHPLLLDADLFNTALSLIQSFEPVGVGARDLSECLRLQLKDLGLYDEIYRDLLDNLFLLTEKGPNALAGRCGLDMKQLRDRLNTIKTLNPKPGLAFSQPDPTTYITPDVLLRRINGQWSVELNPTAYPRVHIDERSFAAVSKKSTSADDKIYISKQIASANGLLNSIEQRAITLIKVSRAIVNHQVQFLTKGQNYLIPLKLKDIALEINMHESTVSRAVNGKYAATPFGIIELKSFFSNALNTDQTTLSNKTIQLQIKQLINMESKSTPLSDDQLVSTLKTYGITVARRTVTKYRESLQIPSSYERKKLARALNF